MAKNKMGLKFGPTQNHIGSPLSFHYAAHCTIWLMDFFFVVGTAKMAANLSMQIIIPVLLVAVLLILLLGLVGFYCVAVINIK